MAERPSKLGFVLLHGAGLGPWIWRDLLPHLNAPGLPVEYPRASANGKREESLQDYAAHVLRQIEGGPHERLIVVAHSLGGVVGLEVANRLGGKLAGFAAVCAAIPKPGRSFLSTVPIQQRLVLGLLMRVVGTRPPDAALAKSMCNDLTGAQTKLVLRRFEPESRRVYTDPISRRLPPAIPALYVVTKNDPSGSVRWQKKMASRLPGVQFAELDSGHLPMLGQPETLARILNAFADEIAGPRRLD